MHTSAHPPADCTLQYTGTLIAPLEIRAIGGLGAQHVIVLRMYPSRSGLQELVAHVPIGSGIPDLKEAQAMVDRINAAAKHGKNALTLTAPLSQHKLICQSAQIDAYESDHPTSATPEKAPALPTVAQAAADLFAEAAA